MINTELAKTFFAALASNDLGAAEALCSEDLKASQNGGPAMDRDALLKFSAAVKGLVADFRYEEAIRSATDTGFVEEHRVRGTLPGGEQLDLMVCVTGDVQDGKMVALREYVDTAAAAGLMKALSPS